MGFWAGIKHALNSTLGTADFVPLDKIFTNNLRVVASDVPFKMIVTGTIENIKHTQNGGTKLGTFISLANGTVRLSATVKGNNHDNGFKLWCVNSEGENCGEVSFDLDGVMSVDINVDKGSSYIIYLSRTGTGLVSYQCTSLSVCCNTIFGNLIS